MRLVIDTDARTVTTESPDGGSTSHPLDSPEAFRLISEHWVTVGWTQKYSYGFTWLGRPIIQLPEDVIRIQEVIHRIAPDVIVETGVAHGGSLIYYASLCKATDRGRVIGVDIEIRPHNRTAIEAHPLASYISLIEGSSIDGQTVDRVRNLIRPGERVLVLLDSCHTKGHVRAELDAYAPLVGPGSYIVAMDGIMGALAGRPGSRPGWEWDNPSEAARDFAADHPEFRLEEPGFLFNEGRVNHHITYWPSAYLRRVA
jgi:cephalosporin hydroxylase